MTHFLEKKGTKKSTQEKACKSFRDKVLMLDAAVG